MADLTCDPNDPRLGRGVDAAPVPQQDAYLVDCGDGEFIRPVRRTYIHDKCGTATTMGRALAETYARDPHFYGATYCVGCGMHLPVGVNGEFHWEDGTKVGS